MSYIVNINKKDKNIKYLIRPGAYALLLDNNNNIATVQTSTGYFLPGGGIEKDENCEDCLIRECIEEIGILITINKKLGVANYFFYSTALNTNMKSEGHFYECKIIKKLNNIKTDNDHNLVWLTFNETIKKLFLKNQQYAVKNYFTRKTDVKYL